MALDRKQKQKIIEDLKEKIKKQKSLVFADFSGLNVKDATELRKKMKIQDCELKIAKKTFIGLAFKDFNQAAGERIKKLQGEIVLGFGYKDEISPFKILGAFSKQNENLKILGGILENEFLEAEQALSLSELPTRQGLFQKLVAAMSAPISNFRNVLQGNIKSLLFAFNAINKSRA